VGDLIEVRLVASPLGRWTLQPNIVNEVSEKFLANPLARWDKRS